MIGGPSITMSQLVPENFFWGEASVRTVNIDDNATAFLADCAAALVIVDAE